VRWVGGRGVSQKSARRVPGFNGKAIRAAFVPATGPAPALCAGKNGWDKKKTNANMPAGGRQQRVISDRGTGLETAEKNEQ